MSIKKTQPLASKLKAVNGNSSNIGEVLKQRRIEKGLSQKEVADQLGYSSAQYISDWERGHSGVPTNKLIELSEILGINQDHLFEMLLNFSVERVAESMRTEYSKLRKKKS